MSAENDIKLLQSLTKGIPFELLDSNPKPILDYVQNPSIPHAPIRVHNLSTEEKKVLIFYSINSHSPH